MTEKQKTRRKNSWVHWLAGAAIIAAVYVSARGTPVPMKSDNQPHSSSTTSTVLRPWISQELRKRMKKMMTLYEIPWEPENISLWGHRLNNAVSTYTWVRETEIVDCMIVNKMSDPKWKAEKILDICIDMIARQ
ncbi:hypothetical protein [Brucella gallinifaecis]|uniref:hypothetical protein n=1 Tax=Brucella gallinifaecis TaxID=215590 RepID=UPI00235FC577|nr:hypothetical protein [Brucella gallinifaecis]